MHQTLKRMNEVSIGSRSLGKTVCLCIVGTRPEAIKMGPVIRALKASGWACPYVATSGQHADLVAEPLKEFGVFADRALILERSSNSLNELFGKAIIKIEELIDELDPGCVVAQGDTSTVAAASLAAFHKKVPFVHVEAGLRTGNFDEPFPEELNRRIVSLCSALHCAPTNMAYDNLLKEGARADTCVITGNTVIDALLQTASRDLPAPTEFPNLSRAILATAHRRESFGRPLEEALEGLRAFVDQHHDVGLFFVTHPNPKAHEPARRILGGHARITLSNPLGYPDLVSALKRSWLVVTDSGGLQEEGPALGKPVLVLRDVTERPEAVHAGAVRLIGTRFQAVVDALSKLYCNENLYQKMATPVFPYGDGHASERIVEAMRQRFFERNQEPLRLAS
jgi:UDP-N-acetylglucosamine 2-epimerase (non-hydrolysing)